MANKGSKKKSASRKSKKKGLARAKHLDLAALRRRPKWIPARAWKKSLKPPQGTGHIDRFYFSNCTEDVNALNIYAMVIPANVGVPMSVNHGAVAPLTIGLVQMPITFETIDVWISVMVEVGGSYYQCDYRCRIPGSFGEYINCIDVGIAKYVRGTNWENELFGQIFGSQGTVYQLAPADMTVIPV